MKKLNLLLALFSTAFSFSQLGLPDFVFAKNRQFHQLQGNEFVVSHVGNNKFYFSKLDSSLDTLWSDSVQFTNTSVNISDSKFTNFLGSNKSVLTLGHYPNGYQIVDSNNLYENILVDFDSDEVLSRTTDTILHSLELQFVPVADSSMYVFIPRRDESGTPYYCETRKIGLDAILEPVAPYNSMTFNELPSHNIFKYVNDTIWIIEGITHDAGYSYSMEIDSLRAYQQFPTIYNGNFLYAPHLLYKQFISDDTLFVMRQFEYSETNRTWILYNYNKDLSVRYYKVNAAPEFDSVTFYYPNSTQVFNDKIYVLAYADNASKYSRIFVYDLNFEPLCEIELPHTLNDQNSLVLIKNQLYYRYSMNQAEYAYHEINHCNQLMNVHEMNVETALTIYPNPSEGIFNVSADENLIGKNYQITDVSGKVILKGKIKSKTEIVNISAFQKGIYLFTIENQNPVRLINE